MSSSKLSNDDLKTLMKTYDKDHDGTLSRKEIELLTSDYASSKDHKTKSLAILAKFDENRNGTLEKNELSELDEELCLHDSGARYAGFSAGFAKMFRYIAFSSDLGEALRPVVRSSIVQASYGVSLGYIFADVGYEAYKLKNRNYQNEKNEPQSMSQLIVERSTFQAVASLAVPFAIIHSAVDVTRKITLKFQPLMRFNKWGPSVVGLSMIPLLPIYLDEPIEHGIEHAFEKYGPWAKKSSCETHEKED